MTWTMTDLYCLGVFKTCPYDGTFAILGDLRDTDIDTIVKYQV